MLCGGFYLGPAALGTQQVGVVVGLSPLLLERVGPHQLPVTEMMDLLPLALTPNALLEARSGLGHDTRAASGSRTKSFKVFERK